MLINKMVKRQYEVNVNTASKEVAYTNKRLGLCLQESAILSISESYQFAFIPNSETLFSSTHSPVPPQDPL